MVLKNLEENGYISRKDLKIFSKKNIKLKKRKVLLVEEAQSFTEEVRRIINTEYGFKKVYSEGLSISTPLNGKYQIAALNALRSGIESYDKRQGWRGPIINVYKDKDWQNKVNNLKIDKTLNWEIAQIIRVEKYLTEIKILNKNLKGKILFEGLKWTGKKNFNELLSDGDIIFVQKKSSDIWTLKQLPKVNGGIVVMDPFNGKVKALVEDIVLYQVNLIENASKKTTRFSFQTNSICCSFRKWISAKLINIRCSFC